MKKPRQKKVWIIVLTIIMDKWKCAHQTSLMLSRSGLYARMIWHECLRENLWALYRFLSFNTATAAKMTVIAAKIAYIASVGKVKFADEDSVDSGESVVGIVEMGG